MENKSELEQFWEWFVRNKESLSAIEILTEKQREYWLNLLLIKLHSYNKGLYLEISVNEDCNELIITAEGNKQEFKDVAELISGAPKLDHWKFTAFKQPQGVDFVMESQGVDLNPRTMWF